MGSLSHQNIVVMLLALGTLLGVARLLGELAAKLRQPAVLGELLAGVLLGPTVLGTLAPEFSHFLFPREGPNAIALQAITTLSIVLFLLVAGLEVDLSSVWRQGHTGFKVSVASIVIPFAVGLLVAWLLPQSMGRHAEADPLTFTLFFATALSISALPVIAKTLMDMNLYRSDLGMVVISAAIVDDLVGWNVFAIVLGMLGDPAGQGNHVLKTIGLTLTFAVTMLTAGRWLIDKTLPLLQKHTHRSSGVLAFALTLALLGAAFTEWIGIHAIFGSFLAGVAIGDSSHLREHARATLEHFISFIFAPVFFASIGLKVNFIAHFDAPLVLTVLVIACACKLLGGTLGARWGGMNRHEAWAVGFAMNSRGAMEIILGMLALQAGIIREPLFVALIVMALVTSMMSGPCMRLILKHMDRRRLVNLLSPKLFLPELQADTRRTAIREMTLAACEAVGLKPETLEAAVWDREKMLSTGIGNSVAIPQTRLAGLKKTVVVVGLSEAGIDFDAPDGDLAHVIFLLLAPTDEASDQLELGAEITELFRSPGFVERLLRSTDYHEFVELLKSPVSRPNLR